jgi:hypothetical protein
MVITELCENGDLFDYIVRLPQCLSFSQLISSSLSQRNVPAPSFAKVVRVPLHV